MREFFNSRGFETFRPALHGSIDKGDIFGLRGWTVQCRDTARLDLAGAVTDAAKQAANAKTPWYVAVLKRRNHGTPAAYAVLTLEQFTDLVRRAETPGTAPDSPAAPLTRKIG